MFLGCLCVDETRRVTRSKPAPGACGACNGGCSKVRVRRVHRVCFIPVWCSWNREVICTRCRAHLHEY
ncbi:hypothetical protein KC19_1G303100 [Ceratodon purpureus]|uniref:Uncharacterized protein n=1 Tax=Ceratodon purpureus TaxID=3225 RepID=A0A8T0JBB6_CERPU|nr:hypothetical protein KC19_1G303100 [Ceratodon purpureus]KAG0593067.1 hypothetical protein KC19_1G303100 [Ceratodon purpureus]